MSDGSGRKAWEQRVEEAGAKVEDEVRRVIAFLNEEVVPEVRRDGSRALRSAAAELVRLAERLESRGGTPPAPPVRPPSSRRDEV